MQEGPRSAEIPDGIDRDKTNSSFAIELINAVRPERDIHHR